MFKILRFILFLVLVVSAFSPAFAAPNISSVFVENNMFIVSGASFGTKIPAAPILWDDFENGTIGNVLQSAGIWEKWGSNPGAKFTNEQAYSGTKSGYNRVTGSGTTNMGGFNTNQFSFVGTPSDELYYSYRWRLQENHNPNLTSLEKRIIVKQGRMSGNGDAYRGDGAMYISGGQINGAPGVSYDRGSGYVSTGYISQKNVPEIWYRHEMYNKLSTPGVSNGSLSVVINGTTQKNLSGIITRAAGESFTHERVLLGLMGAGTESKTDVSFFVDDVYVDNTQSRVEIGNHPNFWSATNREIQIPKEWSGYEIKATINKGRFTNNDQLYIYVVDAGGNPSPGYGPFTFADLGSGSIDPDPVLPPVEPDPVLPPEEPMLVQPPSRLQLM